jgi:hypothetical protein
MGGQQNCTGAAGLAADGKTPVMAAVHGEPEGGAQGAVALREPRVYTVDNQLVRLHPGG